MKDKYSYTLKACFMGIFNQAIYANVSALLFVPFMAMYGFTIGQIGFLVGINFATQLLADIALTVLLDRVRYKTIVQASNILAIIGFALFALAPIIGKGNIYLAIVIATIIFSAASGMLEVTLSPITDTIPDTFKNKKAAMSMMHSFFAWGQIACIIFVAIMLLVLGQEKWNIIIAILIVMPVISTIVFSRVQVVEIRGTADKHKLKAENKKVVKSPVFYLCALAIFFGAGSEVVMNQYISTFCELSLNMSKIQADLVGMCLFALFLGIGRLIYGVWGEKINLNVVLIVGSFLATAMYLVVGLVDQMWLSLLCAILIGLFISLLWPGALSLAGNSFKNAGAWIFSFLAISGDIGCTIFPMLGGSIAEALNLKSMFLFGAIMPFGAFVCHCIIYVLKKRSKGNQNEPTDETILEVDDVNTQTNSTEVAEINLDCNVNAGKISVDEIAINSAIYSNNIKYFKRTCL